MYHSFRSSGIVDNNPNYGYFYFTARTDHETCTYPLMLCKLKFDSFIVLLDILFHLLNKWKRWMPLLHPNQYKSKEN